MDIKCPQCGKTYFDISISLVGRFMRCSACQSKFRIEDPDQLKGPEPKEDVYELIEPLAPKLDGASPPPIGGSAESTRVRPPVIKPSNQIKPPGLPRTAVGSENDRRVSSPTRNKRKMVAKSQSYAAKAFGSSENVAEEEEVESSWRTGALTAGLVVFFLICSITIISVVRSKVNQNDSEDAPNKSTSATGAAVAARNLESNDGEKGTTETKNSSSKERFLTETAEKGKSEPISVVEEAGIEKAAITKRDKAEVAQISKKGMEQAKNQSSIASRNPNEPFKQTNGKRLKETNDSDMKEALNNILSGYRPGLIPRSIEQKVYNQALVEGNDGDKWSEAIAGICEIYGIGTTRNVSTGEIMLRDAARSGENMAINQIALMYFLGNGLEENEAEARRWYQTGAEKGDIVSKAWLGYLLCEGFGGEADLKTGKELLLQSVERNYPLGMYFLALAYLKGNNTSERKEVIPLLINSSDLGHTESKKLLSEVYLLGLTGEKDNEKAIAYLRQSAEEGNVQAMQKLGYLFAFGSDGVKVDSTEGVKWLEKAATNGDVTSFVYLGLIARREGKINEAIRYWKLAENQGELNAAGLIGETLLRNASDQNGIELALESLKKAAEKGSSEATFQLALYYAYGKRTESGLGPDEVIGKNPSLAFKFCQVAADRNHINAMELLADLYHDGIGTPSNKAFAQKWRTAAAKARNELNR